MNVISELSKKRAKVPHIQLWIYLSVHWEGRGREGVGGGGGRQTWNLSLAVLV